MAGQQSQLEIILRARKEGAAVKQVAKDLRDLKKEGQDTGQVFDVLTSSATKAGIALTAMAAAGGVFLGSAVKLAARVETLGVVTVQLGKNIGVTEEEMRSLEQAVVSQGITIRKSREAIASMMQAEIDLAHATDLARLAQDTAVIANLNSSDAFKQLIAVIVTGNVRMGRTLGLQLRFGVALEKGAKAIGKNVDELTDLEVTQIRTNEVMRQGEKIAGTYSAAMETAGKQLLSLDRHIEESRRIIGETYLPIFSSLVEGVTDALKSFEAMNEGQQRGIATAIGMTTAWSGLLGVGLLIVATIPKLIAGFQALGIASAGALGPIGLLVGAIAAITTVLVSQSAARKAAKAEFLELAAAFGHVEDSGIEVVKVTKKQEEAAKKVVPTYKRYVREIKRLAGELDLFIVSQEDMNEAIALGGNIAERYAEDNVVLMTEKTFNLTRMMEAERQEMLMSAASRGIAIEALEDLADATDDTAGSFTNAKTDAKGFFDSVDRGIRATIIGWIKDLQFLAAGGDEIVERFKQVDDAVQSGALTEEQGAEFGKALLASAINLDVALGNISSWEGPRELGDAFDLEIGEAIADLERLGNMVITPQMILRSTIGARATAGTGEFAPLEFAPAGPLPGFQADAGGGQRVVSTTVEKTEINNFLPGATVTINRDLELRAFLNMLEQLE